MSSETIQFWLDYFGGQDIAWIAGFTIVLTQLLKPFLPSGKWRSHSIRTLSAAVGTLAGMTLLGYSSRGAMVGMTVGASASFAWFVIAARLESGSWTDAGKVIAARMKEVKP